jgi:hypothetical protein
MEKIRHALIPRAPAPHHVVASRQVQRRSTAFAGGERDAGAAAPSVAEIRLPDTLGRSLLDVDVRQSGVPRPFGDLGLASAGQGTLQRKENPKKNAPPSSAWKAPLQARYDGIYRERCEQAKQANRGQNPSKELTAFCNDTVSLRVALANERRQVAENLVAKLDGMLPRVEQLIAERTAPGAGTAQAGPKADAQSKAKKRKGGTGVVNPTDYKGADKRLDDEKDKKGTPRYGREVQKGKQNKKLLPRKN